jgi:Photosynthetic reaction centre cytochrome C subunit
MNKKIIIYAGIGLFLTAGVAATNVPPEKPDWKNVRVLPKNIDEDELERIMIQYDKGLGVTCSHCHPNTKPDVFPRRVDFASEELPEKGIARDMIRMTEKINKKYFNYKNDYSLYSFINAPINCNTCHRGLTKPRNLKLFNIK